MRKINRYISRSVTSAIGMVLLVIMALFFVAALIDEMDGLRANYTILEMLIYIGFTLPRRLYEVIPFACLIGWMLTLAAFFCYFWRRSGQTLGMRAWRMKLVDLEYNTPRLKQCFLRCLIAPFSLLLGGVGFFFGVGLIRKK